MTQEEITAKLAALLYYEQKKKGVSLPAFETLSNEEVKPFVSLAENLLNNLDKLNLKPVPKTKPMDEALIKSKIESVVRDFFASIQVWKKDLIPQAELVARIFAIVKEAQSGS